MRDGEQKDRDFYTAKQLAARWQIGDVHTIYALPIRRIKVGRFVRFPRKAVEAYENRGYELPPRKERSA